jgi:hypothetical protein
MPFAIDFEVVIKLLSPLLVSVVGFIVKQYFEGKPKLLIYLVHSVAHPMPPPSDGNPQLPTIHTHTMVVTNKGKKSAHNVRIDHAFFPLSYVLSPPLSHTVTPGHNGSAEILIPVLVPNEQVSISYLYFPPLTWGEINGWVKSDEGMAKSIQVIPSISPPWPLRWLLWALAFVGASTAVYWMLRGLPYLL